MKKIQVSRFSINAGEILPEKMVNSDATGLRLLKNGEFAADVIRFPPNGKVEEHVHPGSHMLFCLHGSGKVKYYDKWHELNPGDCYLIESMVPHAVYASEHEELALLTVADDHRDVSSEERLEMVE